MTDSIERWEARCAVSTAISHGRREARQRTYAEDRKEALLLSLLVLARQATIPSVMTTAKSPARTMTRTATLVLMWSSPSVAWPAGPR